ncbi:MAG: hypothetical protein LBR52_04720 [Prevotellaceae bacterium]|jgi:hypothetical protein|nr:hypothetical protein [Prevotellaceae bacterium]
MALQPLSQLKAWFRKGLKPTEGQFWDTWDSFWHKEEKIPMSSIENLNATLNGKGDTQAFTQLTQEVNNRFAELQNNVTDTINELVSQFSSNENSIRITLTEEDIASGSYELDLEAYQSFIIDTESGEPLPHRNFTLIATGEANYDSLYYFSFPTGAQRFMILYNDRLIAGSALTVEPGTIMEAIPVVDGDWLVRKFEQSTSIYSSDGSIAVSQSDLKLNRDVFQSPNGSVIIEPDADNFHLNLSVNPDFISNSGEGGNIINNSSAVENFPVAMLQGGQNYNNEFRGMLIMPESDLHAGKVMINPLANHTSGSFEIAVYDMENGQRIGTTGVISFAGIQIGFATYPLENTVHLQKNKAYSVLMFFTGSNRYVGSTRIQSQFGSSNQTYAVQGGSTESAESYSQLAISQSYPESNQLDIPYIRLCDDSQTASAPIDISGKVNKSHDEESPDSVSSGTRIIRVPANAFRRAKGLVITCYTNSYSSRKQTYEQLYFDADNTGNEVRCEVGLMSGMQPQTSLFHYKRVTEGAHEYLDVCVTEGREMQVSCRVTYNPTNCSVDFTKVTYMAYYDGTWKAPARINQDIIDALKSKVNTARDYSGYGFHEKRIIRVPYDTSKQSATTVLISLYAVNYANINVNDPFVNTSFAELLIDCRKPNDADKVKWTGAAAHPNALFKIVSVNGVRTWIDVEMHAGAEGGYWVSRVAFNPNNKEVNLESASPTVTGAGITEALSFRIGAAIRALPEGGQEGQILKILYGNPTWVNP